MASFRYRAAEPSGGLQEGILEATTQAEASRALGQRGLMVLELKRDEKAARRVPPLEKALPSVKTPAAAAPAPQARPLNQLQAAVAFRQLSVMFEAGISLHRSISSLAAQADPALRRALNAVAEAVAQGSSLSAAMQRSGLFSGLQVGVGRCGEESGTLGPLLQRLARLEEQDLAFQQHLRSKLSYPVGVAVAMLVATAVLTLVMAQVVSAMGDLARTSPVLGLLRQPWLPAVLILSPLSLWLLLRWAWQRPTYRPSLEELLLRLPLLGELLRRAESSRLCRVLSVLASSGIRIDRSLALTAGTTSSPRARQAMDQARQVLQEGEGLTQALRSSGYFPPEVLQMAAAGESSGRLPEMLARVADYSDQEVSRFLDAAVVALEPLLLGLMGILVGATMLTTFAPLYGALQRL